VESEVDLNVMIKCKPAEACVGVERESDAANQSRCLHSYEGRHCADCDIESYRFYGECRPCGKNSIGEFRAVIMFGYVLLICCCSIDFSSRKSTYTGLGLTLNALQIMGLFNEFWFSWPTVAKPFFAAAALTTFNLDLFAPECKLRNFYPEGLYERATLWLFLPIIFFACYAAIYGIMFILR